MLTNILSNYKLTENYRHCDIKHVTVAYWARFDTKGSVCIDLHNCHDSIYTIYVHCRKIYNLFVQALETGRKASLWRVQINFIFNDNVCRLCLSCNIKKA